MHASLNIVESTDGSRGSLALLRWALVVIFLWFGGMKFTGYEANGHLRHRVLELATAIALIAGAFDPIAIGAAA